MYHLGIDLGTTFTAAAIARDGTPTMVGLGDHSMAVPSVLYLLDDGTFLVGEPAERRGLSDPGRLAREFKRRIGDSTPIMLGGSPFSPQALTAQLLRWVVDRVSEREGGVPERIAVTHPANWRPFKTDLLAEAVELAGLDGVTFITEPEAAALHWASQERVDAGTTVVVYDLGGGTFDIAILEKTDEGFRFVGRPAGIEHLGGLDLDAAVFEHVRAQRSDDFARLDPDDPALLAPAARLRADCTAAKESLSSDTTTTIPLLLPGMSGDVRLTRAEFEQAVRPALDQTIEALRRALKRAELEASDVDATLLVGGSSRVPLVGQLVAGALGSRVAVDTHPKHAVALGAALVLGLAPGDRDLSGTAEHIAGADPSPDGSDAAPLSVSAAATRAAAPAPPVTPPPPPAHRPRPAPTEPEPPASGAGPISAETVLAGTPTRRPTRWPWLAAAAAVVAALIVGVIVVAGGGDDGEADTSEPQLAWRFDTRSALSSRPAVADGTLVIGATITGTIHGVDVATGSELWSVETGDGVGADAAIADGVAYIGGFDGFVYALALDGGREVWTRDVGAKITGGALVADGIVYVGDETGTLWALDASSGEVLWDHPAGGQINSTPALVTRQGADEIVVGDTSGGLSFLDRSSGMLDERLQLDGGVWFSTPLVLDTEAGGQELWVGTSGASGGQLNRVIVDTLEIRTFENRAGVGTDPAVTEGGLIVAGNDAGELFAVDRVTLGEAWREGYADATQIKGSPVVSGDRVFFGTHDRELIAVRDRDGERLWSFEGSQIFGLSAPVVAEGRLYVGNDDGVVYAFDLDPEPGDASG